MPSLVITLWVYSIRHCSSRGKFSQRIYKKTVGLTFGKESHGNVSAWEEGNSFFFFGFAAASSPPTLDSPWLELGLRLLVPLGLILALSEVADPFVLWLDFERGLGITSSPSESISFRFLDLAFD